MIIGSAEFPGAWSCDYRSTSGERLKFINGSELRLAETCHGTSRKATWTFNVQGAALLDRGHPRRWLDDIFTSDAFSIVEIAGSM